MGHIVKRTVNVGTAGRQGTAASLFVGSGILEALEIDYSASSDSGTVVTITDGGTAAGSDTVYTRTSGTDAGTTVPVPIFGDADIVAGTATAGVGYGSIFVNGLWVAVTLDVAGSVTLTAFIRPLIKKSVNLLAAGSAGSAAAEEQIWNGPGIWHGYHIRLPSQAASTSDYTFHDGIASTAATVMTKTNYQTIPTRLRKVSSTTGHDEAGADVTTAATGSYPTHGIYLRTGLRVKLAQGNAGDGGQITALFEN